MAEPLAPALARVRALLLDEERLLRAALPSCPDGPDQLLLVEEEGPHAGEGRRQRLSHGAQS